MAWMMPLSHSTSDGQLEDLDGPSDLRPMMAPSSQFLRNLRYAVRVPPLSVFWSVLRASIVFLPSITWYLSTSAVIGVPTSLLCLSKAELAGARSVYSPPERSTPITADVLKYHVIEGKKTMDALNSDQKTLNGGT